MASPRLSALDGPRFAALRDLTDQLARTSHGHAEHDRFRAVTRRRVRGPASSDLAGETILVTGGTGCIGTALLTQLAAAPHRRIVSLSRGLTRSRRPVPGVEYARVDVRSAEEIGEAFRRFRPDAVFHLAAVRDPGAAEREVRRTVETNVFGSRNVFRAAEEVRARRLVFASTGKAVRYFTRDVYAATKKLGESLLSEVNLPVTSAVRFTHVVDNSLILGKLRQWCEGGTIRLHSPDIAFHGQSALESAQLMVAAAERSGQLTLRNLEWPFSLLDLALGVRAEAGSSAPIYFCGYEAGYEAGVHRASYDPATAGDAGPLINALESYSCEPILAEQANRISVRGRQSEAVKVRIAELASACADGAPDDRLRRVLGEAGWSALRACLHSAPPDDLQRFGSFVASAHPGEVADPDHALVDDVIAEAVRPGGLAAGG
ncbi:polysaccharide biosynthesis protein [Pseudonocardia sp. RS010]|uniref:polysaccharide biosynthesis protein n=1 Tax=Pseudonocardia sp. RS010 TaxID=3385979 RepID=UPI0039A10778